MKLTRSHALLFGAALLFAVQGASSLLASDKHYVSAAEVKRNTEIVMSKIAWTNELEAAKKQAEKEKKLIFWLQIVGELDGGL